MIMNYNETEKFLDEIRNKDEMMFRMAVSHLMDVGIRHLTPDNVEHTCATVRNRWLPDRWLRRDRWRRDT